MISFVIPVKRVRPIRGSALVHIKGAKHVRVTLEFEVTWCLIVTDFAVRQDVVNGQHLETKFTIPI